MIYRSILSDEAKKDIKEFNPAQQRQITNAIQKVVPCKV